MFELKNAKIVMFCGPEVIWGKVQCRIWNPHRYFQVKEKKLFKSVKKQRNYALIKKCQNRHV